MDLKILGELYADGDGIVVLPLVVAVTGLHTLSFTNAQGNVSTRTIFFNKGVNFEVPSVSRSKKLLSVGNNQLKITQPSGTDFLSDGKNLFLIRLRTNSEIGQGGNDTTLGTWVYREKLSGVNGVTNTFNTRFPIANEHLYRNGLLQEYGDDYTIVNDNQIIFDVVPVAIPKQEKLVITYQKLATEVAANSVSDS